MFAIFGGTEARRLPRSRPSLRVPWLKILLIVVVIIAAVTGIAVASERYSDSIYREQVLPAPVVSEAPAPEPQVAPVPAAIEWPKVEVKWVELGSERAGQMVSTVQIPSEKFTFVPGPMVVHELNYPADPGHVRGEGDGTAFIVATIPSENSTPPESKEDVEVSFTPDKGATWFTVANPYPGRSSTPTEPVGALLDGDTLVLYIALQSQPWVNTYWRADVPLATLEGLSP